MSCIINCQGVSKRYSFKPLFENLTFGIHQGQKLGLLGRNGVGKSTLLKILLGQEPPDAGNVTKTKGLKVALIAQFPHFEDKPVFDVLCENSSFTALETEVMAKALLTQAGLDIELPSASHLSGGQKKKLDILKALMQDPDVLFLDEPTNHLDLDSVLWLEQFLQKSSKTLVIVSHDRMFLSRVCRSFIEISPMFSDGNFQHEGTLEEFFEKKQAWIEAETKRMQALSHQVEHEIAWTKRSPKARTTKSVYRVQKALDMEKEYKNLKSQLTQKSAQIQLNASERETRLLVQAKNLSKSFQDKALFKGLDLVLTPGKKIGLLGPNGCGKTTLLKLIAKELLPDSGTIKYADKLDIVYFDQHKMQLNPKDLVKDVLCPSGEFVNYNGQSIHVNGWAKRFLFTQDTLRLPVEKLSGGEKSRLLIAKLMLKKADILLLDEPTNDLDIQTLEMLEDSLLEFKGSCLIISHDRYFLNQVCDYYLALSVKPEGEIFFDFESWENQEKDKIKKDVKPNKEKPQKLAPKLSSKELKELKTIQDQITDLEKKSADLEKKIENLSSSTPLEERQKHYQDLGNIHQQIEYLFTRWEELDQKQRS